MFYLFFFQIVICIKKQDLKNCISEKLLFVNYRSEILDKVKPGC